MDRRESQVLTEILLRHEAYRNLEKNLLAGEYPIEMQEAETSFMALVAATAFQRLKLPLLVILPSDREAEEFYADLEFFGVKARLLPWWRTAAYRSAAVRSKVFGDRASVLAELCGTGLGILVASHRALATPVPPRDYFASKLRSLKKGDKIEPQAIAGLLANYGYLRVPRIALPGEFAQRGEVVDIFMPGDEKAVRIHFDYDTIDKITGFDVEIQSQGQPLPECTIRPLKEVLWDSAMIDALSLKAETLPGCAGRMEGLKETLGAQGEAPGEELWYGLAFDSIHSILEYMGRSTVVLALNRERLDAQDESLRKECAGMYRPALREMPVPPPDSCFLPVSSLLAETRRLLSSFALKDSLQHRRLRMGSEPPKSFFGNLNYFREDLNNFDVLGTKTIIVASSAAQAERIRSLLPSSSPGIFTGFLSAGFYLPSVKLRVVQEGEIFGRRRRIPKSLGQTRSSVIDSFVELSPGDYVVHINYGIGRFSGIDRMRVLGNERDYIKVEYADSETVFVPIEQANLIQRYIGNEGESPRLDKLGSKSWESRKSKVRKSVEVLAERLIRIYARRKTAKGFAFPPDEQWQAEFEASFPFDETVDQLRCVEEIKRDMEQPRPMDRLVCGDVGYGKTEVALRACFKAMAAGKQVAFLAPTTILAEQHFESFQERLRDYPLRVEMLSRLVEKKKQKKTLAELSAGSIDMVVGTHRLLQKDVVFKDLGLLVIDEEQRFGVKDKERLKEIKAGIDCLTLTATPIPRTLHMSMLKIRDMSILQTPPEQRQPIQTYVEEFNHEVVARAIRNELERGGQIFYLHNRIESLPEVEAFIRALVPEALTETAHGQMDPGDLEDIMHRFIHGAFHVLVSTTIIENGIDIPNVNTIIIDRADFYGISQLYQLRGRVGRSDRQAYAYLLYPDRRALSEIAMKRLQIISDFTELGSGFKIAMKDLEVRGAGNLLGREQSGDIYAVGFDLYLKLLDDAVSALSGTETQEEEPYLELEYTGYIPDEYISMPMIKMEVYKKIASIYRQGELDSLQIELENRFGSLPDELLSLLALAEIRILCRKLSVSVLREKGGTVTVEFSKVAKISVERLLKLMRESNGAVKLDSRKPNAIVLYTKAIGLREKSEFIRERLASLT